MRENTGTLIAYFVNQDEALDAFQTLQQKGYHRAAWVTKNAGGDVTTFDPFRRQLAFRAVAALILGGALAALLALFLQWGAWLPAPVSSMYALVPTGVVLGVLLTLAWYRPERFGVDPDLLGDQSRWLVSGESVVLLQGPMESLRTPRTDLLHSGTIHPAVLSLHPKRHAPYRESRKTALALDPMQLQAYARDLAAEHRISSVASRDTELLKRLERGRSWVQQVCVDLTQAANLEQSVPPTAEWLLDNEYILESNARDVKLNLPRRFFRQLPRLNNDPFQGLPRVYALVRELATHTDLRVDQDNILTFLESYQSGQSGQTMTIGELWAVPQMLRTALIESIEQIAGRAATELRERQIADCWANRLITANRRDPDHLFGLMAELTAIHANPSAYFASQLLDNLYEEADALAPVQSWLERVFHNSMVNLIMGEKKRQLRDQVSVGNAFSSLRQLALIDWKEYFERLSLVERTLREDPAGIYPGMDFVTRDRYRRAVEDLHRGCDVPEVSIARQAVELAARAGENAEEEEPEHVGAYLIGEGREALARQLSCRETRRFRALQWAYRHHTAVYFGGLALLTAGIILLAVVSGTHALDAWTRLAIALLLLVPASQLALEALNYLVTRLFPPHPPPKMDFARSGIPDDCRTLVVVPMMLVDAASIQADVERLEIRYLANQESNLLFALLSDFTDASQAHCESDAALLQTAREGIEALRQRHGGERFLLLHRERTWSDSEQKYMGWERKRGKLEELNDLILGTRPPDAAPLVVVGDPDLLTSVRYVITLDSDTQLPHGAANKLIATMAHPLNRARPDDNGGIRSGYTIIQPCVSPTLPSASGTLFSRLFSDAVGVNPYSQAMSDAYQDLTREGSYYGKGIYDVRAFSRVLSGRFPQAWLLSHDLIEGAHVRVGLASDIELYEEFPQDYLSYAKRQHRWVRGDWQIAGWILPRVPLPGGKRGPNPLRWFDRWKVFDNLRRSLLPATCLGLLALCWLTSVQAGWMATIVVAVQLFFQSLTQSFNLATTNQKIEEVSPRRVAHDLLRTVAEAALMPYQACLALDAIARVAYRRHISHRKLLEWTTSQAMAGKVKDQMPGFLFSMGLASLFGVGVGVALALWLPANLALAGPWLLLWIASPLVGWLLSRPPRPARPELQLPPRDLRFLRNVSRRTWRYFDDFVNEETNWLPPDNFQVSHQNQLAMRTSPTNVGLYLVSVVGAHDFGYLTLDQVVQRLARSMETIEKMERHEGHLLNWYDIESLQPLNPRYVSTVDSGNLLGSLWTLDQALQAIIQRPLLGPQAFAGLYDTGDVLRDVVREAPADRGDPHELDKPMQAWSAPPGNVPDALRLLRRAEPAVETDGSAAYWTGRLHAQREAWLEIGERYLTWIEVLAEKSEAEFGALAPDALPAFRQALHDPPSLHDLARGKVAVMEHLRAMTEQTNGDKLEVREWIERVIKAFERAKWLAGEMLAEVERLCRACRELSASINMRFLYNAERRLFSIGFNVSEGRLDRAFYDLLASEVRLGSYVAIARGDVPAEHWFALGRPYGAIGHRRALLSWTGTMFEYLMPLLFQRSHEHSLLDKATKEAVAIQIDHGRRKRTPWGISECAFGDMDLHKTYQYFAFGVPELGLKRYDLKKHVVAPYATLLALSIAPRRVMENLGRLTRLNLLNDYGYYEALDYSRQPNRESKPGVIVRAYMAHHKGMSFLALANFLLDGCIQDYFHADPRVRTFEPLLFERIPSLPPLHHVSTRERITSVAAVGEVAPSVRQFDSPHTVTPKTQLLYNGRYALMLTNAGGGYSRWGDFEITRWRSDTTSDHWGAFCYIRDLDSNQLWCNTYHPIREECDRYSVNFSLDRAEFRRVDNEIECETEIIVAPEDDVEIRRVTLINRSSSVRRLELTSYLELAMAPHRADVQHATFSRMFIQTQALPEQEALMAWRRPRDSHDPPIYVAHRLTLESGAEANGAAQREPLRFETDRRCFIGRGRTLADPMGVLLEPTNSQGFVLDPILSLRRSITLAPGQRTQISLILAAGPSREHATGLMTKYADAHAVDQAMDFAWGAAQLELRLLRIQPDDARRFQQLAGHLLYPNPLLRAAARRISANRKGQSGLWVHAISGDLPIVLALVGDSRDLGLVRQVLQAHSYWRMHGLMADLVILNEEETGYTQPLREALEHLIHSHAINTGVDKPGGVFLRSAALIPPEDLTLLRSVAGVVLTASRGGLAQQLSTPQDTPKRLELAAKKRDPRDPSAALPFMELPFFNSLGGFTPDGHEYVIYLGPGLNTPAPWVNVIANPSFGTLISETGAGFTWQGNSQRNRLTQWFNDPVMDPAAEAIYLRDEETGIYWTPTASPIREDSPYRARHGTGYTVFEHNSHGIEQDLTVFVPVDDQGGQPVKLQRLLLHNDSRRARKLSLTYYVEWTLGEARESSQMQVVTEWDEEDGVMLARNHYHPDYADQVAFAAVSAPAVSHTADRTAFLGRNRSAVNPAAMEHLSLSRRTGAGLDPCAAIRVVVTLAPGERTEVAFMLGQASSTEDVRALVTQYRSGAALESALRETQTWWDHRLGAVRVQTPELAADFLVNRWLLYQSLSCRMWGRSGFYQSGGAYGYRDQLQDVMALLYTYPSLAREHILRAAGRQFKEGDVQHWWHPPSGAGIRSHISDDLLWLPYVTAQYVRVTNDVGILHEVVPFLDAPLLAEGKAEEFQVPEVSQESGTLYEHCQRTLNRAMKFGANGLPLMGTGDWNDGMNLVGEEGKGESVWLAWFMVDVLRGMAELADALERPELSRSYRRKRTNLVKRIEGFAWDGAWYLRATFDDGSPLGASGNAEAQIDSLPQSWAWLSGAADKERARQALESAWSHLVQEDEGLVLLFEPPFDQADPSPGYIQGYPPGVRENGGQYTHAAIWLAMAMARSGDGTRAATIMRMLNPVEKAREPESVWRYGVEPYVIAADVYRLPGRIGQGGWTWYTGSAAWMYRAWVEEILGLDIRADSLRINPVIPEWWEGFQISYRHGEALYEIQVENPDHCEHGVAWTELDGQRVKGGVVPLERALVKHRVVVRMGRTQRAPRKPRPAAEKKGEA